MKLDKYDALDIFSTVFISAVLYVIDAPWFSYVGMVIFGTAQRMVGLAHGKARVFKLFNTAFTANTKVKD